MPDLETKTAQPLDYDPLSKLHKMSTTAGLGSGDYVAVNILAVVTAITGVASILANLSPELLIIPVVGVIFGIIAIRQIRRSNGTQTGTGIAIIGLLLSLGLGGFVVAKQATKLLSNRGDEQQIAALIEKLGETIKTQKHQEGYALFGGPFPARVSFEKYKERMEFYEHPQAKKLWGDLQGMRWNGHTQFSADERTGEPQAATFALAKFSIIADEHRYPIYFRKLSKGWVIENIPDLFPAQGGPSGAGGVPPPQP